MSDCELFQEQYQYVIKRWNQLDEKRVKHELIRRMINKLVVDLIENTLKNIQGEEIHHIDDVRDLAYPLVSFSDEIKERHLELKRFLSKNLYRHEKVMEMSSQAGKIIHILFKAYMEDESSLNDELNRYLASVQDVGDRARVIANYIAGMTDRFAIAESQRVVA